MSTRGVKYIFIMVDNFTKFVKLYTMKRATTVMLNKIKLYILEVGKPVTILSDNGTQVTSKRWSDELLDLQIRCV